MREGSANHTPRVARDGRGTPSASPAPALRASASLVVLRDGAHGLEVLLGVRAERPGDQNSRAAVFPGGLLDAADGAQGPRCRGLDDAAANARLGLDAGALAYWVAAVRECFEEVGLLFAVDAEGQPVDLSRHGDAELLAMRQALHAHQLDIGTVCDRLAPGGQLALDRLAYSAHWITPLGLPKLYDTRFFVAEAPPGQHALADGNETVALHWLRPAEALQRQRDGTLRLMNVTERIVADLQRFARAADAVAWARAQARVPVNRPRLGRGPQGRVAVNIDDWPYAEIGRLDPHGRGNCWVELTPGRPVWLSPRVCRVTAPNGNLMTGPGTNSYFIGDPARDDWALLDPGPDDAAHIAALRAAAPGRITRILVTHTHKDHSPAVQALVAASGAPTWGRVAAHPEWQDASFRPDHVASDGDRLALGEGVTLRALHTPGHASNHLCWLLEEEKLLFTGDHLMQGSTVVISPPDGDMAAYLASLRSLLALELDWLAPGHGFLIDQPHAVVHKTIAHRLAREAQVLAAVRAQTQESSAADEDRLLATVYAQTPRALHAVALRSLRAHLLKLRDDGLVEAVGARWRALDQVGVL